MGLSQFKLTLAEISNTKSLRINTSFYDKKELANTQIAKLQKNFKLVRLAELTRNVAQGLQVRLETVTHKEK